MPTHRNQHFQWLGATTEMPKMRKVKLDLFGSPCGRFGAYSLRQPPRSAKITVHSLGSPENLCGNRRQGPILGKVISGGGNMFVRYILLSKGNGSQTLVPQRDALLATGGDLDRLSEDLSSFRDNDHPGLVARLKAIQPSNILVVWKLDPLGQNLKYRIIRSDIPERVLPPPDLCPGLNFSNKRRRHPCTEQPQSKRQHRS